MSNTKNTSDSQPEQESSQSSQKTQKSQESHSSQESRRPRPMEVLREARAQLAELTGMTAESVSSFEQTEDGWALEVEVLELERVPDTMSLMASYQVELDSEGMLTGYRRVRRYERGRSDGRRSGGR
ncbi:gas vesicle protein [Streptomyces griseoviridis]|nr:MULTISPECIES: gas vesicle protein [Streptomyces]GGS95166.1 gas vesicle protein [Streptomyces griseoviridis]GGU32381.1 gas vesicle protein [Streptomyces daghestanicus]GHI32065.1 gas vesicle protein [Streptomyces daghestanicus]